MWQVPLLSSFHVSISLNQFTRWDFLLSEIPWNWQIQVTSQLHWLYGTHHKLYIDISIETKWRFPKYVRRFILEIFLNLLWLVRKSNRMLFEGYLKQTCHNRHGHGTKLQNYILFICKLKARKYNFDEDVIRCHTWEMFVTRTDRKRFHSLTFSPPAKAKCAEEVRVWEIPVSVTPLPSPLQIRSLRLVGRWDNITKVETEGNVHFILLSYIMDPTRVGGKMILESI